MLELVGAADGRLARIGCVPWAEMAARLDFARRQSVQEGNVVTESLFATDCIERQRVNLETQRLASLTGDFQPGVIGDRFSHPCRRGLLIWRRSKG